MSVVVKSLITFLVSFVLFLLVYLLFINRRRKEYSEGKNQVEITYLVKKFGLDMRKTKYKTIKLLVAFMNSFILAFTFTLIINFEVKYFFKLLIAFVIMVILIYSLYEIAGRALKKKENKKTKKEE